MSSAGRDFQSAEIRAQLARILASRSFARANRSCQLLSYLVECALEDRVEQLKEYPIAVGAFGRDQSFDPRIDSLVRVEFTRLRNRLTAYYETATEEDTILISLSPGSYLPLFERRIAPVTVPTDGNPKSASSMRRVYWLALPILVIAALAGFSTLRPVQEDRRIQTHEHRTLRRLSLPQEVLFFPALSPNGKDIYYASNRGHGAFRIWRQPWNGGEAVAMTPAGSDAFDLDVSPDGRWIAYRSARHGGAIYQQAAAGGEELFVAANARSPRFSPDSRYILYWREGKQGDFDKVFKSGITPGRHEREPIAIAPGFDDAHHPQWTPDMRILLCGTYRTNVPAMEHDLWIVGSEGSDMQRHKTGILPFLSQRGITLHPRVLSATSFRIVAGGLIFSGLHNGRSSIYRLPLTADWRPSGEPVMLHDATLPGDNPAISGNQLAFATLTTNLDLWELPLNAAGLGAGVPRRLTHEPVDEFSATASADGRTVFYVTFPKPLTQLWRKDTGTGVETLLLESTSLTAPRAAADGGKVFFRTLAGPPPQRQAIHAINTMTGTMEVACEDCGTPTSVSPQSAFVAFETGSRIPRIAVLDTRKGAKRDILSHPHHGVHSARFSPGGERIAFELDKGVDGRAIFVAPFRGMAATAEQEWMEITSGGFNCEPAWSPDGSAVYFLSDRNGTRELWRRRVLPGHKPEGSPDLVFSFTDAALTPIAYTQRNTRTIGLTISRGRAVLTLSEVTSGLQVVQLAGAPGK